jgi:transcriptional regulator with XRE-family HTH domain
MLTVADRIRGYLAERSITNLELSRMTGIDPTALSKALNNKRKIDVNEYILIIKALNLNAGAFLEPASA